MFKKFLSAILSLSLVFSLAAPAFAAEPEQDNFYSSEIVLSAASAAEVGEIEGPVYEVMTVDDGISRSDKTPSSFYNLGGDNYYTGSLIDLAATRGSYTLYYFATGTGNIYVKMDLERSGTTTNKDRSLKIKLYEKSTALAAGTLVETKTVSFNTAEATRRVTFTGLDSNKFYYVYFYNASGSSSGSSLDISCTAIIDDSYN